MYTSKTCMEDGNIGHRGSLNKKNHLLYISIIALDQNNGGGIGFLHPFQTF